MTVEQSSLTIAVAQPEIVAYDVEANAAAHAASIRSAQARVVVFPELSLTGYELDAPTISTDDPRLNPVVEACAQTDSIALVGAPVNGSDGPHIAILAVDASGVSIAYRKMHLGGAESSRFAAAREPAVLRVDGWRLGLAICKDTGVVQHAADTAAVGMDVYVAGMLESADDAHVIGERARRVAKEHHICVAIASFAGTTGGGYDDAAGGSGIWTPDGNTVVRAGREPGAIVRATLAGVSAHHVAAARPPGAAG